MQPGPTSPQHNITVMASAGTGKTWMLVSRLLRLLLHGARADAILAITFTRKAAAEMQSRLSERLFALASADDQTLSALLRELSLTPDRATMARARGLFEELLLTGKNVRTTTFHAFCQEILRRFPLEADVPPGFELLEGSGELARGAWELLIEEATTRPDSESAQALEQLLGYCGGLHGLKQALLSFLEHRSDWWAFTEGQAHPLSFATTHLQRQLQLDDDATSPLEAFFSPEREEALAIYSELLGQHPIKAHLSRLELLAVARDTAVLPERRFDHCREALLTQKGEPRVCKPSRAQAAKMGDEGQDRFIALHGELCSALLHTLDQLTAIATLKANRAWYLAGDRLLDYFQRLKAERRQLDFTDLEWRAYRLLHHGDNAQWVQYKLDQRIEHLLVDEFQDTNPTQWRLLLPLLQEMASGAAERQRSVFLVGDAKQSIYRFRRAEPRLFQAAHGWLSHYLDAHSYPLHTSWRSSDAIMQGVNKLFGDNGPMGGILHDFTPHDTHLQGLWGSITLLPLITPTEEDEPIARSGSLRNPLHRPREIAGDERHRHEGEMIATEINRLIAAQTPVGQGSSARPLRYGDIMILLRSRSHAEEYETALRQANIPYVGAARGTLLESLEVRDMVALLELLITPFNSLAVATVLRSPLFACTNDDLAALAMEPGRGNWYQRLANLAQHNPAHPLHRAWQLLDRWHGYASRVPIHDLLDRIYSEGNVLARYRAAYPPHLQARSESNLTRFLELALAIDSGRYPSLGRFLARLGEMRENSDEAPDEAPAIGHNDRVRIMTIHASKGLESPVVFIADSAHQPAADRPFHALVEWAAEAPRPDTFLLLGKKGQQAPFSREALQREHGESIREDANLLYVAITRARQHIYLSACAPHRGEKLGWYGAMRKALDPSSELELTQGCRLESSEPPPLSKRDRGDGTSSSKERTVGEGLNQRLTLASPEHEIAPSYQNRGATTATCAEVDEDGRRRGIAIHRLLELITEDGEQSEQQATWQVADELALSCSDGELLEWVAEAQRLYQTPSLQQVMQPSRGEALNEVPIIYQRQGVTVHGVIDRLLLDADEAWVIDYKTHRHATTTNIEQLAHPYHEQLSYYAQGVKRIWPDKRVRTFLLFTACSHLLEVPSLS